MFPFWIPTGDLVCQLETTKYGQLVGCSLFLSINVPASSQAKGEGAPGSSGPVHSGHMRPKMVAKFTENAAAMADAPDPVLSPDILEAYLREDYRSRLQPPDPAYRWHGLLGL